MKEPWVHISEVATSTLEYIVKRQTGEMKSLKTGYPKLDDACIDGIEWGSNIAIGARPAIGKTGFSSCIIRNAFIHNDYDFEVLDCNWEMASTVLLIREISASIRKSYKYILSAEGNTLSNGELKDIKELLEQRLSRLPIHYIETPQSPKEWKDTVKRFVDKYKKPTLVRVDHTVLGKVSASDGDKFTMISNLMAAGNELKKQYPLINMFLTQLKPEFESRQEDGTQNAFCRMADAFFGDNLAQFSETMIFLNNPSKYGITYYGNTGSGMVVEPNQIFAHVVKNRNSAPDLIIPYREDFKHMSMYEL